jgi:uncharacterized protein
MTPVLESVSHVATTKPVPYMRQLCKHFGHNNEAEYGERTGSIRFPYGLCELRAGESELTLTVSAEDTEALERMEHVVGSHLERFGRGDELAVSWQAHE